MAIRALRESAIEFCSISQCWLYSPPPIDVVANQGAYAPQLPASPLSARLGVVRSAKFNGRPLLPTSWAVVDAMDEWGAATGPVTSYTTDNNGQSVSLIKAPEVSAPGALILRVSLVPSRAATDVPDFLFDDYEDAIAAGAKFRLLQATNPGLSQVYRQRFLQAAAKASNAQAQGRSATPIRVTGYPR